MGPLVEVNRIGVENYEQQLEVDRSDLYLESYLGWDLYLDLDLGWDLYLESKL